jgi:glycosyltransferase involved in cell wall biosynthesis
MRVGINALYLIPGAVGGTETYLRSVLSAFAEEPGTDEFVVFVNRESEQAGLVPARPGMSMARTGVRAVSRPSRLLWEQWMLPRACARARVDVLLNPGFTAPLVGGPPSVTIFHDLQYRRHPEFFKPADLIAWRLLLAGSVRRSARIVCISESTRADLLRFYRVDPSRVDTVLSGIDDDFRRLRWTPNEDAPYLLTVSTLHPHKNLERLLQALAIARQSVPAMRLVLAGLKGFATEPVERAVSKLGLTAAVEITGWIPRAHLLDLFRGARAFIYPSLFEGFGLPVGEAMAAGIPVVCSDIPPLREVAGDAALRVDPYATDQLAAAMVRIWQDAELRARFTAAGRERAARFDWRETARGLIASMRRALEKTRSTSSRTPPR